MSVTGPFYICILLNGQKHWFWRGCESVTSAPQFSPNIRDAKFKQLSTIEGAVAYRDTFRAKWPTYEIWIETTSGLRVGDDRTAEVTRTAAPTERQPMHCNGILIRPASCDRWCIRMSNNIETIYGDSPESVYEKLTTVFPQLVKFAEPYVEPQMSDQEFAAMLEQKKHEAQRARFPGRRRPGDIPR